jgi:hypothetical protein
MKAKFARALVALLIAIAAGGAGYVAHEPGVTPYVPTVTVAAPAPGSVRVLYSLSEMQNDKEIIALIEGAGSYIYFAIYTFTLPSIADALVAAKERGVAVYGIIDSEQAQSGYGAPIAEKLVAAGIPVRTEKHRDGNGIMHIKAIVTESAYAIGSYNWTKSATTINDEILEVGTDPTLRAAYENILKTLYEAYAGTNAAAKAAAPVSGGTYDYTEAKEHVGEYASVRGTLIEAYTSKSGTVFLDFCENYKNCSFSAVIFADDVKRFGNLAGYEGSEVTVTGKIKLYEGRAEIVLESPDQLRR